MRNLGQNYFNAVVSGDREWANEVVVTDGTHTETYSHCEISIEEVMSDSDNLSMGKSFTKELTLKVFEPLRTVSYKNSKITVNSKLKVGNSYTTVKMGEYYASEVTTSDDYATLDIKAYDFMAKLNEPYAPNISTPYTDTKIINDIRAQYGYFAIGDVGSVTKPTCQLLNAYDVDDQSFYDSSIVNGEAWVLDETTTPPQLVATTDEMSRLYHRCSTIITLTSNDLYSGVTLRTTNIGFIGAKVFYILDKGSGTNRYETGSINLRTNSTETIVCNPTHNSIQLGITFLNLDALEEGSLNTFIDYTNTTTGAHTIGLENTINYDITVESYSGGNIGIISNVAHTTTPLLQATLTSPNASSMIAGHKYLYFDNKESGDHFDINVTYQNNGATASIPSQTFLTWQSGYSNFNTSLTIHNGWTGSEYFMYQLYDLTELFGAGNEPTTWAQFIVRHDTDYHPVGNETFRGLNVELPTLYEGTVAETLGYMAGLQGKNAVFDMEGKLAFRWYTESSLYGDTWNDYNGITWNEMTQRWGELGGSNVVGRENQKENGLTINEGSFTIQSITSGSGDNSLVVGTGKGITFECPYMTQALLNAIGNRVLNSTYRIGKIDTFGNPMIEVGDIVNVIDKEGNFNVCYCSNITWGFSGGCNSSIQSVGNPDAEIEFSTESPTEKKINTVKSSVQEAQAHLSEIINTADGVYSITIEDGVSKGWTIVDNPLNPRKVVVATNGGIGIGHNGLDGNYDTAITGDGIVADRITSGTINAIDINGSTITGGTINGTTVNSNTGNIGGWTIDTNGLTNGAVRVNKDGSSTLYTCADLIIVRGHILGKDGFNLGTGSLMRHYDFNNDGQVTSVDYVTLKNLIGLSPD